METIQFPRCLRIFAIDSTQESNLIKRLSSVVYAAQLNCALGSLHSVISQARKFENYIMRLSWRSLRRP
jgi:hypothetical protein